jgi:hypothetical protein
MTEFLFPDNTVLCDFAAVDHLDLLRSILGGRGRWTEAVAYEAGRSERYLPALASLKAGAWLGEPIEVTDDTDIRQIELIRRVVFGGTENRPLQHLGEAQSCYLILNWAEFAGSWWITNDRDALRYARSKGITTRETIDLMSIAVSDGDISAGTAFHLMRRMVNAGRSLRVPRSAAELSR